MVSIFRLDTNIDDRQVFITSVDSAKTSSTYTICLCQLLVERCCTLLQPIEVTACICERGEKQWKAMRTKMKEGDGPSTALEALDIVST